VSVYHVIDHLPDIATVRDRSRAMAMLDAIMSNGSGFGYYSFDAFWSPTEAVASMSNGSGDEYRIFFTPAGAFARGFDHESSMSPYNFHPPTTWPGLFDAVPAAFRPYVVDPVASWENAGPWATVCFWRQTDDPWWMASETILDPPDGGLADDGAWHLFEVLVDGQEAYQEFAENYYERVVPMAAVHHVYALKPLTQSVISSLNPLVGPADLAEDILKIGYPV
jgi:hypothetical protein